MANIRTAVVLFINYCLMEAGCTEDVGTCVMTNVMGIKV